jgi:hypothetical protein
MPDVGEDSEESKRENEGGILETLVEIWHWGQGKRKFKDSDNKACRCVEMSRVFDIKTLVNITYVGKTNTG